MARDMLGNELAIGDTVICRTEGEGIFIKDGKSYIVTDVKELKIRISGWAYWWSSDRFQKDAGTGGTAEVKADRIMALINGRPWSPSREEILEILRS